MFSSQGAVDLRKQNCACLFFSFLRGGVQERRCFEEGYEFVSLETIQGRTVQPHQQYQKGDKVIIKNVELKTLKDSKKLYSYVLYIRLMVQKSCTS